MSDIPCISTLNDFQDIIYSTSKVVVVYFYATWCPPCRKVTPFYHDIRMAYTNIVFYKVDTDENNDTANYAGIEEMPTFKFYRNGYEKDTLIGTNCQDLEKKLLYYNSKWDIILRLSNRRSFIKSKKYFEPLQWYIFWSFAWSKDSFLSVNYFFINT